MAAVASTATALDLPVHDLAIMQNSNKLALRLLPCDVFARVAAVGQEVAALERLHAGMRKLDVATPHFTDRIEEAQRLVADRDRTPAPYAPPDRSCCCTATTTVVIGRVISKPMSKESRRTSKLPMAPSSCSISRPSTSPEAATTDVVVMCAGRSRGGARRRRNAQGLRAGYGGGRRLPRRRARHWNRRPKPWSGDQPC